MLNVVLIFYKVDTRDQVILAKIMA